MSINRIEEDIEHLKNNELVDVADENLSKIAQTLDTPLDLSEIITPPNAVTIDDVVKIVNAGVAPSAVNSIFGKLIDPGKIGIVSCNGVIQAIGPGRYVCPNPRASIRKIVAMTENPIQYETLTIIRVQRGQFGLAIDHGQPVILGEGLHVRNTRLFQHKQFQDVNQQYLHHGSLHIIRVPRGHFGLITENNVPKLLAEGIHVANSNVVTFDGLASANQPHLSHSTIHLVRVAKGEVALVFDNNRPKLVSEGTHFINSNSFNYVNMQNLNQQVIRHGTITRFRVRKGEIGLAWENNNPSFFEEGIYEKDSPNFSFEKCVDASEKQIALGAKKIITVWDGEVGVSYLNGKLKVLFPNRHMIESAEHIFQGFLSTQQQCLHLIHVDNGRKSADNSMLLTCETKDFVEIGIKADVFYRISDPEKVLLIVGKDSVIPLVRETSIATLNSIIRSTSLAEVAQSKEVTAKSSKRHQQESADSPNTPSAPLFFDKVHDEFISKLHDTFSERYGIEICNIRIESFKIINQELASNISKQALTTTQTETQLANLASQTEIATAQQKRDTDVARIKAEGEAIKLRTETDAHNRATMDIASAEAEATLIQARATSQALTLKAEAEAKAILLKADAEAKGANLLSETTLGGQISLFQLYADMVKSSMQGVEKVIYLPSDAANNPFSFMSLQQGMMGGGFNPMMGNNVPNIGPGPNANALTTKKN